MSTIFDCYGASCIESFIEAGLATVASLLAINGLRVIFRDRNKLLNRLNKIIYGLAVVQLCLLDAYFVFWGSDFMISSIRCIRILNEILLCVHLAEMVYDEVTQEKFLIFFKILAASIFVEWFWTGIVNQSLYDYYCLEMDYVYMSGTTVILTLMAGYFGLVAIDSLQQFKEATKLQEAQDIKNKANEIYLFLFCDFLSAILQFAWDYIANMKSNTIEECKSYYEAESIPTIALISVMKILTLMISPLAIYYVLYHKYRNQFNTRTANQLEITVLWDRRSDLIPV